MGDRGHNRHGPKRAGAAVPLSRSAGNPSNTMWPCVYVAAAERIMKIGQHVAKFWDTAFCFTCTLLFDLFTDKTVCILF